MFKKSGRKIGDIAPGQSAYTEAFDLDARYIIHTVGMIAVFVAAIAGVSVYKNMH